MPPPISGLRTIKRDFSSNSACSSSSAATEIPWSPSPPQNAAAAARLPSKPLSGRDARMKAIQDALRETASAGPPTSDRVLVQTTNTQVRKSSEIGLSEHNVSRQKRPSDSAPDEATAKRRLLPWQDGKPRACSVSRTGDSNRANDAILSSSTGFTRTSSTASGSSSSSLAAKPNKKGPAAVFLSQEQTQILKLVESGESIFYTGSAGTGKSVLLREIIKTLRKKYAKVPDAIAVTASTGMAACNIGGVTIHSFAGIGLGIEPAAELANKIKKNKKAIARWLRTKVLIIDEVSMVEGDLFDKLCDIGRILTKRSEPFGRIQLVVTGDFFQLPPVVKSGQVKFAFEAANWSQAIKRTFNLTKVFRQSDQTFVNMLNEMRFGTLSGESIARFRSLNRPIEYTDGIEATELFPRREEVERANNMRMTRLKTESHTYFSTDGGAIVDPGQREKMLANFMAPGQICLRIDSQVMLIKNMDDTLVNGSLGRVVRFVDPAKYSKEEMDEDGDITLPAGGASAKKEGAAKKKGNAQIGGGIVYPVVEFFGPGNSRRQVMIQPEGFKVELPSGEVQCSRTQLPLILAWAMSIHKSQGQTLERVKVDLGRVFEKGQAYVALSRCTCLEGLQVFNFDPTKVIAHPKVIAWSKTLETIGS